MKKIIFITVFVLITICSFAQTKKVYCELLGYNTNVLGLNGKVKVIVDFGDKKNFWGNDGRDLLVDEKGKDIKFNSMVDAMNYMSEHGWHFEAAYPVTIASQNVIHWLLSKNVEIGQDAKDGIQQRRDKKESKESKESENKHFDDIY